MKVLESLPISDPGTANAGVDVGKRRFEERAWVVFNRALEFGHPVWAQKWHRTVTAPPSEALKPKQQAQKTPQNRGVRCGGYGWTRTTDPSIMSAVL